ncbi:hypothetical protein ACFL55_01245 [Candidatus Latescibacterota bacterium]
MSIRDDIKKYYRFCTGLRSFVKHTISCTESRELIRAQMERRQELLLTFLEKAVYNNPRSPHRTILKLAGYESGDLRVLIESRGIEPALRKLAEDGGFVTFEEFKGRKKVMRGGQTIDVREIDFDNPFLARYFEVESSGTGGAGTRSMIDFDFLVQEAINRALVLDIYGLTDAPCVIWFPILPGNAGIKNVLRQVKIGNPPVRWFSQVDRRRIRPSLKDRLGTGFMVHAGRLFDARIPKPEYVDVNNAETIVRCLADLLKKHTTCCVWTYVNSAIRICSAAKERHISLTGAHFFVSGEPVTRTKRDEITSTGARVIPYYAFAEGGIVAYGCANPDCPDDMHILSNRAAIITHKKEPEYYHGSVNALLVTSLIPASPKILLNTEMGDHGVIRSRRCGCGFEEVGFYDHLSQVRSFEKCTSEGMTFMVNDLIHIAENVLPAKYGGTSVNYQFSEYPGGDGVSHLNLAVSPEIGPVDVQDVIHTVLDSLKRGHPSRRMMAEIWSQAGTIRVVRMEPLPTRRGKLFSFLNRQS